MNLRALTVQHLQQFVGIFVPGGHAPMEDLARDKTLGQILAHFHQQQKPTALICHGPAALLSTYVPNQKWIYSGYKMTAFSTAEEVQEEKAGALEGLVSFYLQDTLSRIGGLVSVAQPWNNQVVSDRELVTGQNPMSEKMFTQVFLQKLNQYRTQRVR